MLHSIQTETLFVDNITDPSGGQELPEYAGCDISTEYDIFKSIVAAACITFGILYTFFGYRFFKAIMFLTGFIFGTVLVFMILREHDILPPEGILGCALGAGVLLGLFTMLLQYAGLFLTGFNLGVAAAAVILIVVEQIVHPYTKWIPIGVFLVLGVLFGILSFRFQKTLTVISTSVFGAAMGLTGIDYFVELSRMALYVWDHVKAEKPSDLCWYSWFVFALWPAIASGGTIIQWKFTSYGVDHRLALRSRREQGANLQQTRAREKRETQQTRYRHLYQARRVKGDVISQNFTQTIHHKLSPAMQSLTALSSEPSNEEESTATTTLT
ncbi:unnamed protein product [Candidula unifasciata]|uniref:Transmembrane protein 198 n=1 Tax=Candidula unifasciata TaxID=100452 RepID=A0A8S3Z0Y9_9EUPU|nr:unnamed protein product [Candidula unifasciata]